VWGRRFCAVRIPSSPEQAPSATRTVQGVGGLPRNVWERRNTEFNVGGCRTRVVKMGESGTCNTVKNWRESRDCSALHRLLT
jgi:hypothetical protein